MDETVGSPINVLIIGNNPSDLTRIGNELKNFKGRKFITDFCFSTRDSLLRILKFKPECILVDENLDRKSLVELSEKLYKNKGTRDIPLTLLKSSYKKHINVPGFSDFLLKDNLSADSLCKSILNVMRFRKTQRYLYIKYKRNKRKIDRMFKETMS